MENNGRLPYELSRLIEAELSPQEQVLWSAQPLPGRNRSQSVARAIFGLYFIASGVVWVVRTLGMQSHVTANAPMPVTGFSQMFPFFGLLPVLVGLGLLSSPYWRRRSALRTAYLLTNQRALIVSIGWRGQANIQSIPPPMLADRQQTQNRDGSGSLLFTGLTSTRTVGEGGTATMTTGFKDIPDVRQADELIRQTFEETGSTSGGDAF